MNCFTQRINMANNFYLALVCKRGEGEPKNFALKLTLAILLRKICEFHKMVISNSVPVCLSDNFGTFLKLIV